MDFDVTLIPAPAPQVTVRPVEADRLPPIPTRDDNVGHYQQILFDLVSGELQFFAYDWRILVSPDDREAWRRQHPGMHTPPSDFEMWEPAAPLRCWIIDSWAVDWSTPHPTTPRDYLTAEQAEQFLAELAPLAQRLAENMVRVPGTDDLDWSAAAMAAARDIGRACSRHHRPPAVDGYPDLVDFADVAAALPDVIDPQWVAATDAELDRATETLIRHLRVRRDGDRIVYANRDVEAELKAKLTVCGIRAWLYAYRAAAAANLTITDAADWYTTRPAPVTASTTDDHLTAIAEAEQQAAAAAGAKLVGLPDALRRAREVARDRVWAELGRVGTATAAADAELRRLRAVRTGLIAQIIGWDDARSRNGAELGRQAHMSREAIANLRDKLENEEDDRGLADQ